MVFVVFGKLLDATRAPLDSRVRGNDGWVCGNNGWVCRNDGGVCGNDGWVCGVFTLTPALSLKGEGVGSGADGGDSVVRCVG